MKLGMLMVTVALVACGDKQKTNEDYKKEYGAKLEARLAKLSAASAAGKNALTELGAPGDAKLGLDFEYLADSHKPNAIVARALDLEDPKKPIVEKTPALALQADGSLAYEGGNLDYAEPTKNHVWLAKSLLGVEKSESYYPEYMFRQLLEAKYVLVVYPKSVTMPREGVGNSFEPGTATATALLIEIDTAKALGGFEFSSTNSEEIGVNVSKSTGTSDASTKLKYDFYAQTGVAISDGIKKRWPDAKKPYNWGYGY